MQLHNYSILKYESSNIKPTKWRNYEIHHKLIKIILKNEQKSILHPTYLNNNHNLCW